MPIDTNLNTAPYYDDYDETKNFHRILFRPEQAVQARELTQLQSILQNQFERFGDNIFTEGTIVKGCNFNYDASYHYVKLRDLRVDLTNNIIADLVGLTVTDLLSGLSAVVVNSVDGFETQNPDTKTIYVKYMNTGAAQKKSFSADDTLTFYRDGVVVPELSVKVLPATLDSLPTNPVGVGYAFSVTDGVIYQKGHFVRVESGTSVIVSKYTSLPDTVVVGFQTEESIITEYVDPSLLDNAQGFDNENAPGAHRLKLTPVLVAYQLEDMPTSGFFVLAEWKLGQVVRENRSSNYNVLGQEFARRTSEESGDYVVNPFVVTTTNIAGNTSHLNLETTQGLAYVSGYRVEKLNNLSIPVRKGNNTAQVNSQQLSTNYGNYVLVKEALLFGFASNALTSISLRDAAASAISVANFTPVPPGNQIGTAKLLSVVFHSGIPGTAGCQYRLYLTDIRMSSGKSFSDTKAFGVASAGVADAVLESGKAVLKETAFSSLIFPLSQGAIKTLRNGSNNNNQYIFRTTAPYKIQTAGTTGAITLTGGQQFPYGGAGTLNETQEAKVIVVPFGAGANVATPAKTGTVTTANANTSVVTGNATTFLTDYQPGDFIYITSQARQITSIANNTSLNVVPNFTIAAVTSNTHAKHYPAGTPIPITDRNSTITLANTTSMSITLRSANGTQETLSSNLDVTVHYDVQKNGAVQLNKQVLKSQFIRIDCSNNVSNTVGPWSLGLPDVYQIAAIYKANTYTDLDEFNVTGEFVLDTGQTDTLYGISAIKRRPNSNMVVNSGDKLTVKIDVFKPDAGSGYGFFSVDSYPIDDGNTANTTAITTAQIPQYASPTAGKQYNLRDSIDCRPIATNNAIYTANSAAASVNPANTVTLNSTENYVASPNQIFSAGLEYYLGRIDKLVLDTYGNFSVVEGNPDVNPKGPQDVAGAMTISTINVKPYPSLSMRDGSFYNRQTYTVSVQDQQVSRFTMKDLRSVQRRVENLEYYTSLSLLEKKTVDLVVRDSAGLERFKNGIFVETFDNTQTSSVNDMEFSATIDTQQSYLRPSWDQQIIELQYTSGSGIANSSQLLSLNYTEVPAISQPHISKARAVTPSPSWDYTPPTTEIWPPYDPGYDVETPPVVVTPPPAPPTPTPVQPDPPAVYYYLYRDKFGTETISEYPLPLVGPGWGTSQSMILSTDVDRYYTWAPDIGWKRK